MLHLSTIDAHVAGQPLRLIVGGLPKIAGGTMAERLAFARRRLDRARRALMLEPRGHRDMTGAVLTETATPGADAGVLFLDADGWRASCGHGLIAAVTIAIARGLLVTGRDDGRVVLDTVDGPVAARAWPGDPPSGAGPPGIVVPAVTFTARPAMVVAPGVSIATAHRHISADLARCGDLFAIVDAEQAGVSLALGQASRLRDAAGEILARLPARHRPAAGAVIFTGPPHGDADLRAVPIYAGGCLDRSPSGLGLAALTAVLDAMGLVSRDRDIRVEGASGLCLTSRLVERVEIDGQPAIRADITGSAWITGEHTFIVSENDPLAEGWSGPLGGC